MRLLDFLLLMAPVRAALDTCDADQCSYWIDEYGNTTTLKYEEFVYAQFYSYDVTNLWQIEVCGDVDGYPYTYGEFQIFLVDDENLRKAIKGEEFQNCSCSDGAGRYLSNTPVPSSCVDGDGDDVGDYALSCNQVMDDSGDMAVCSTVLVQCLSKNNNETNGGGCRLGVSALVVIPDPFDAWWSFEYIPIVFGFCLVVVFISVFSRHMRRQQQRAAARQLAANLLNNEVGGGEYGASNGTVVAEGTIVDDEALPSNVFVAGNKDNQPPTAAYVRASSNEKIFQASVEQAEAQQEAQTSQPQNQPNDEPLISTADAMPLQEVATE